MKQIATWIRECDQGYFAQVFAHYPHVSVRNARTDAAPFEGIHGLLLTGGSDISSDYLRQEVPDPSLIQEPDPARDAWEFPMLARALERGLPVLAICRGHQVLNVALDGTLHLDIPNHDGAKNENVQELRYIAGAEIQFAAVNSSHHQAVAEPGRGLQVEAWYKGDDVIEQARLAGYPFALGVQYHPERDPLYRPLFDAFVNSLEDRTL